MDRDRALDVARLRVLGDGADLTLPVWLRPIETARLRLVPPSPEHANAFADAVLESDRELSRWSRRTSGGRTHASEVENARQQAEATALGTRVQRYALTRKAPEQLVGVVTIHPWLDPRTSAITRPRSPDPVRVDESPDLEIGTWCRTSMVGNGFATEAVAAVVDHAFAVLRANVIWLRVAASNAPSRRVAARLGFVEVERLTYPASAEWGEAATVLLMKRENPRTETSEPPRVRG